MQGLTRRWEEPVETDCAKPLVERILAARGIESREEAQRFLDPKLSALEDPSELPGALEAAEIVCNALREGKKVLIYGDYDADGITASAVLYHIIAAATNKEGPSIYIPSRIDEGYGINPEAIVRFNDEGIDLIISVDCGITAVEAAQKAVELGITLIVTDHHKPREDGKLPDCAAIVHPGIDKDPVTPFAGVGVAYQVAWAFARSWSKSQSVNEELKQTLLAMIPFVAIGTIADMVPLKEGNRILARWGLQLLPSTSNPGLRAIMHKLDTPKQKLNSSHISFGIAPLINAVGRLAHAATAVDLLTHLDGNLAEAAASELYELNRKRQIVQRDIVEDALKQIDESNLQQNKIIVLQNDQWSRGVVGVAAGKCVEIHYIPTILLSGDGEEYIGSARSITGFSMFDALCACAEHLSKFGGHDMAAGLTLTKDSYESFVKAIKAYANKQIDDTLLVKLVKPDVLAHLHEINLTAAVDIEKIGPFGIGNPAPIVQLMGVKVDEVQVMGSGGVHLSMKIGTLGTRIRCIWWNNGKYASKLQRGTLVNLVGKLKVNEFRRKRTAELDLLDIGLPSS
ncbi:MAG: single-stranded-DNA-specific exonuclease RecJ [Planctomycetes bacterium]|nr:single-stranded-DNA-specific exonuclease RecJ [Planctomycetota bacterium]